MKNAYLFKKPFDNAKKYYNTTQISTIVLYQVLLTVETCNLRKNIVKKLSILALTATIATAPAFAETTVYQTIPNTTPSVELSTQPTQEADLSFAFEDTQNLQAVAMTDSQMQETEGAVAPLVAIGVIHGGRFIAQRWVTQRVAVQVARKSGDKFRGCPR
ncbi:hypothetical protein [Moraxella ovis]|uniref:hypothetical protein n=1 Tax=Moraxella ovis TaxID=29433 RepID=UPI000D896EF2|nr:hypothetical protein [Moraxella ovis]SPX86984.1 Uncharacterised protein [Moraxella ovis]STZ06138.1 Uncharacterised protein [Moraxella ovis]